MYIYETLLSNRSSIVNQWGKERYFSKCSWKFWLFMWRIWILTSDQSLNIKYVKNLIKYQ